MNSSALPSLQSTTLNNTVGAAFLGVLAATFLFGFTTLQIYWYYHLYPRDSLLHKYSVAILWILDAFHLALTVHAVYTYVVTGFGDFEGLHHIVWSIKLQVSVNVVIILIVHSLYALRVWILGEYHRGIVGYVVAFVLAGGFVVGIVLAYEIYTVHSFADLSRISWIINSAFATATGIDFVITAAMCYYLRKSQAPASRLNSRISTVMQYTLSSGLFTSACSLSAMFCYILLPNTFVFLGLEFLLTKLYVASFLTMLNARKRTVTANTSTNGLLSQTNSTTPITDLIPRRYQLFRRTHSSSQSRTRVNGIRVRPTTSSFWSPTPPPPLGDHDQGDMDCLPYHVDLEYGHGEQGHEAERSLSDESETIQGTLRSPKSPTSPTSESASVLALPQMRQLSSVYDEETHVPAINPDSRPVSASYPWHAR